jgi:alpha-D-ribose 1-methylphosphonate 5-triphosphate synthase subunit PhnI
MNPFFGLAETYLRNIVMAYVAARGGEAAIQRAEELYHVLNGQIDAAFIQAIARHMPYLVDRVMAEGSLYAPDLAALALAQTGGDLYEAVLLLRAYRSTQPRLAYAEPLANEQMLTVRRISAAFQDIPGGQFLGPTLDYSHRLLRMELLDGTTDDHRPPTADDRAQRIALPPTSGPVYCAATDDERRTTDDRLRSSLPELTAWQRLNGLLDSLPQVTPVDPADVPDVTREPVQFPAPRAHRLQALARADTGGVLALGYAGMRGYGLIHPTVNEIRLSYADVRLRHPITGAEFSAGRVRVTQGEILAPVTGEAAPTPGTNNGSQPPATAPRLRLGFAATLGWNEVKVIAGATLDLEMSGTTPHPAHQEEFVLYHTEAVEASGFCIHFKLPHYVTFASSLDSLRRAGGDGTAGARSQKSRVWV